MQLLLGVLGQSGERGTAVYEFEPHAAERVLMLGCDECRRREWRGRRRRVISPENCDMLHTKALDIERRDTGYRESASDREILLPKMCSTVKRYVETGRDHVRRFGEKCFAADNH